MQITALIPDETKEMAMEHLQRSLDASMPIMFKQYLPQFDTPDDAMEGAGKFFTEFSNIHVTKQRLIQEDQTGLGAIELTIASKKWSDVYAVVTIHLFTKVNLQIRDATEDEAYQYIDEDLGKTIPYFQHFLGGYDFTDDDDLTEELGGMFADTCNFTVTKATHSIKGNDDILDIEFSSKKYPRVCATLQLVFGKE